MIPFLVIRCFECGRTFECETDLREHVSPFASDPVLRALDAEMADIKAKIRVRISAICERAAKVA